MPEMCVVVKNSQHRGKQQYKCKICGHQFTSTSRARKCYDEAFASYCHGKQALNELSAQTGKSVRTLQRQDDRIEVKQHIPPARKGPDNLIVDATFFSRRDGVSVFRDNKTDTYWRFIVSESLSEVTLALDVLEKHGYQFQSITLDLRRGMIQLFEERYPAP